MLRKLKSKELKAFLLSMGFSLDVKAVKTKFLCIFNERKYFNYKTMFSPKISSVIISNDDTHRCEHNVKF